MSGKNHLGRGSMMKSWFTKILIAGGWESAYMPHNYHCLRIYNADSLIGVYVAHLIRKPRRAVPPTLNEELEAPN
jgi:hypothetical protein